jgi:hypothetical protein
VNWPTQLVASANMTNPVVSMTAFIDGQQQQPPFSQPAYTTDGGVINLPLKVFTGAHSLTVQATDSTGAMAQSTINVVGEPNDMPPVAAISLRNLSPNTVLACGVGSSDPDGFITRYSFQFSDGMVITRPGAVHTGSGTGSVTLTVTDQFGAQGSSTQSFSTSSALTASQAVQRPQSTTVEMPADSEPIRPH